MARYLGVDYGLERTGLATGEDGGMAFPLTTLSLKDFPNRSALLDALAEIAREQAADALTFGLPRDGEGRETPMCASVRNAAKRVKRRVNLPVYYMPEYLSSAQAWSELSEAGVGLKKRKELLDQQAARVILESFLNLPPERRESA